MKLDVVAIDEEGSATRTQFWILVVFNLFETDWLFNHAVIKMNLLLALPIWDVIRCAIL